MHAKQETVRPIEKKFIMAMMPILFRSVYGWHEQGNEDASNVGEYFDVLGIDDSVLKVALFKAQQHPAKGIILLCHPFLKYGMSYFFKNNYHAWLNRAGYHVLGFNFKGFGESSLSGIAFSDDVYSVAQWAGANHPELPLHLLGTSFGAYHGIHSVARYKLLFSSVVFDSVPFEISSFFGAGAIGAVMRWLSRSRWAHPTGTKSIMESLSALNHTPCMFMYGSTDNFITKIEIEQIRARCKDATVNIYQDCGHLEIRKTYPDRYIKEIANFFDMHNAPQRNIEYVNVQ